MTDFIDIPNSNDLQKLSGHIKNFRKSRETANFFFTARDQSNMRLGAILSALIGDSGQAASLSGYASSMEDAADFVQFELEERVIRGWLWGAPFKEGDYVEVAVKKIDESYVLFGMCDPARRIIALYPHCSRGRISHLTNAMKWIGITNIFLFVALCVTTIDWGTFTFLLWDIALAPIVPVILVSFFLVVCLIGLHLAHKWMPFARLAESVFCAMEFQAPSRVDLVKSSRNLRKADEILEGGGIYFKY
ncbi:putative type VI secretion system effector [uncultured Herbaspirillum sp.]|uniref:putative type VI secretion system effector n=1 Tax=uncultured Herbaspirillum sp. TaxID=160236 RepID=UPI0025865CF2|nr:putative type VI secretion system effector [uncultured Herbaspirillum sp.]